VRVVGRTQRHAGILDTRLAKQKYVLGDTYTIVDMNVWGWEIYLTLAKRKPFNDAWGQNLG
jgi:GST-like protein